MRHSSACLDYSVLDVGPNWTLPLTMAGYTLGTLGTLQETIKETRHFRPQGTREMTEK